MVSKKTITKIINKIIFDKCHLNKHLHGEFGTQIRKTLHQLTKDEPNSKEEYKILRDAIFEFYQKYNSEKRKEILHVRDNQGNVFKTKGKNNDSEVDWTKEMIDIALKNGLFYSIHNHPLTTSIQSGKDLQILLKGNVKYSITLSNDGIMIIKNNNIFYEFKYPLYNDDLYKYTRRTYDEFDTEDNNNCKKIHSNEYDNIHSRLKNGEITKKQADEEWNVIFRKYSRENVKEIKNKYMKLINDNDKLNMQVMHIPKTPRYKKVKL